VFLLFAVAKALHMARVRMAGGNPDAALVGRARGGGAVGGGGSDARVARFRVAGAGQRRNRHGHSHAPGALHRRLRPFVRVRDDGAALALAALAALRGWNCCGWPAAAFLVFLPRLPDAQRGHETALLVQPNISETEEWTAESVDRAERALAETPRCAAR
jgi:hypothetical protein